MAYKERELSRAEIRLASMIREHVPRSDRLEIVQQIAHVAEDLRDRVNEALYAAPLIAPMVQNQAEEIRKRAWDSLHFPRYRFFDAAIPDAGWGVFTEWKDAS